MKPWPSGLFCLVAGLWLTRLALTATDERLGRLTATWPTPWPTLSDSARRGLRFLGAALGLALCVAAAILLT